MQPGLDQLFPTHRQMLYFVGHNVVVASAFRSILMPTSLQPGNSCHSIIVLGPFPVTGIFISISAPFAVTGIFISISDPFAVTGIFISISDPN